MKKPSAKTLPPKMAPPPSGLSNSERQLFTACRRKYFWQYVRKYSPLTTPTPFIVGSALHEGLRRFYKEKAAPDIDEVLDVHFKPALSGKDAAFLSPEQLEDLEKQRAMTAGMLMAYFKVYADDLKQWKILRVEEKASWPINSRYEMYFTLDLLVEWKNKPWIVEHKSTASIDHGYVSRLSLDDQVSTYLVGCLKAWGVKPEGVIYNAVMKPRIRQKQGETLEQYLRRVVALYEESPAEYLYRAPLLASDRDLSRFEKELDLFTAELDRAAETGFYYTNTTECARRGVCPYMALCVEGEEAAADRFKIRSQKSQYEEDD